MNIKAETEVDRTLRFWNPGPWIGYLLVLSLWASHRNALSLCNLVCKMRIVLYLAHRIE